MLKKIFYFILVVVSVACYGCAGNDAKTPAVIKEENYKYSFSDTSDIPFIEGKMKLFINGDRLIGEYTIDTSFSERPSGFSSLPGALSGNIETSETKEKTVFLNMNPKLADNNIFVYTVIASDSLKGYWVHSSMVGIKAKGNFIAVKTQKK
jgi:hypothetical protein